MENEDTFYRRITINSDKNGMRVINFYYAALVTQKLINISYDISRDIKAYYTEIGS